MSPAPDLRDEVAAAFEEIFGRSPDGLWSAPGVVELRPLSLVRVDRRTVVALGVRDDRMLRVASLPENEVVEFDLTSTDTATAVGWTTLPLAVVERLAALGADLHAVPGADVLIDTTVDDALGADAAFAGALELALADVWRVTQAPDSADTPPEGTIIVVPTDDADLALETLLEADAHEVRRTPRGAIALVDAESVSRVQVAIDGAFAEHGLGQPEVLVARPSTSGALRER